MADVRYQGFVPHRPAVPMVRSMSFHGLPTTGHGIWHATASPLDIPGASLPRQSRRLPYLLSVSVPDNADAVLSRSLLEQCRLDSISDHSPRSSSLKQYGSWASKVFSEAAGSNKASLSTCASSSILEEEATEAQPSVEGTDTTFIKKKHTERRPELHASALSAALRGSDSTQEGRESLKPIEQVRAPSRDAKEENQRQVQHLQNEHDDHQTGGNSPKEASTGEQLVVPILIPSNQRSSPATSSTGSSSSTGTWSDWSDVSSPGVIHQAEQRRALVDRLMEYCYAILANNLTDVKGDTSTSYAPSSTPSSSQGGVSQSIETSGQSNHPKGKKRSSHKDSDASGESDDDEGDKGLGSKRVKMEENMGKRLACPFFKRNPQRYQEERSCVGPGWRTVHRLKEHIYRCHTLPIHCLRCHETFASEESLQIHSLSDTPCQRRQPGEEPRAVLEGIGLAQERRLRSRKRTNKAEEDKWRDAYRICFPDDVSVPSPYYEIPALSESITSASSSGLVQYEDFVRSELPRRVRLELDRRLEQEWIPIEERLRSQLSDMMRDIQLTLLEEFRLRGARAATESLPASTPSTNQVVGTPQRRDITVDCASIGANMIQPSATKSIDRTYVHNSSLASCSASYQALEGYRAVENSGDYASLQTGLPLFGSWDTSRPEDFMISRDGGLEDLNWAGGNDGGLGCFVPDIEDWARSWGNRA